MMNQHWNCKGSICKYFIYFDYMNKLWNIPFRNSRSILSIVFPWPSLIFLDLEVTFVSIFFPAFVLCFRHFKPCSTHHCKTSFISHYSNNHQGIMSNDIKRRRSCCRHEVPTAASKSNGSKRIFLFLSLPEYSFATTWSLLQWLNLFIYSSKF